MNPSTSPAQLNCKNLSAVVDLAPSGSEVNYSNENSKSAGEKKDNI